MAHRPVWEQAIGGVHQAHRVPTVVQALPPNPYYAAYAVPYPRPTLVQPTYALGYPQPAPPVAGPAVTDAAEAGNVKQRRCLCNVRCCPHDSLTFSTVFWISQPGCILFKSCIRRSRTFSAFRSHLHLARPSVWHCRHHPSSPQRRCLRRSRLPSTITTSAHRRPRLRRRSRSARRWTQRSGRRSFSSRRRHHSA